MNIDETEKEDGYYFDNTDWCPNGIYVEDGITYGLTEDGEIDYRHVALHLANLIGCSLKKFPPATISDSGPLVDISWLKIRRRT